MSDYMDSLYENLNEESLAAITAGAGYNDGANNGFWRVQPRLPKFREGAGQWMEMGAEVRAAFKKLGQLMSRAGKVVGSGGTADTVRILHPADPERGLPEEIKIYPTSAVELIGARLSPEYLRSIGRDPNATGTGISAMSNPDNLPNYEDLPTAPVTDDDRRIAEQGVNSPEGQEMTKFKDSPEGQEVARLEPESAADVLDTPAEIARFMGGEEPLQRDGSTRQFTPYGTKSTEPYEYIPLEDLPKRYKGLKETSPGVWNYKDGSDGYRFRKNKQGKWEIYAEASNSDFEGSEWESRADRSAMRGSWVKLDSGEGFDSVDDVMDRFFGVKPTGPGTKPLLETPVLRDGADAMKKIAEDKKNTEAFAKSLKDQYGDLGQKREVDVNEPVKMLSEEETDNLGLSKVEPGRGEFQAWESEVRDGELVRLSQDGMGRWQATSSKWFGGDQTGGWEEVMDSGKYADPYDALDDSLMSPFLERPSAQSAGVPEGFTENPDGSITRVMPNGAEIGVSADGGGWSIMASDGRYALAWGAGPAEDRNDTAKKALDIFNEDPDSFVASEEKAKSYGFPDGWTAVGSDDYLTFYRTDNPDGALADMIVEPHYIEDYDGGYELDDNGNPIQNGWKVRRPGSWRDDEMYDEDQQVFPTKEDAIEKAVGHARKMGDPTGSEKTQEEIDALINRARLGKDVSLDDLIGMKPQDFPDEGDDENSGKSFDELDGPSDADLMDIEDEVPEVDDSVNWNDQRRTIDVVEAYDVGIGDFVMAPGAVVGQITDVEELDNGDLNFAYITEPGGGESFFKRTPDQEMKLVTLGVGPEPKKTTAKTEVAPKPEVAPEPAPEPEAPATARTGYDPAEIEAGDEMFTKNGAKKLGNVTKVRKKADGTYEARLESDGSDRGWWPLDNETLINKPGGDKTPEPITPAEVAPEAPASPSAASFQLGDKLPNRNVKDVMDPAWLDDLRKNLEWVDEPSRFGPISEILDNPDMSHTEKLQALADLFGGTGEKNLGVFSLQREDGGDHRLAGRAVEGFAQGDLKRAGFTPTPAPTPVEPEEVATPEPVATPSTGEAPVAPPKRSKPKIDKTQRVADPDEAVKPSEFEVDNGEPIAMPNFGPPPPGGPEGDPDDPNNPWNIRWAKVDVLRDENGNKMYEADDDGNPIYDQNGDKIELQDPEALKALIKKFFPNAKITADGLGMTIARQSFDGTTFEISIKRTDRGNHSIIVSTIDDATGERKDYISVAERKSWQSVWNLREKGGGNSPFAIWNMITGSPDAVGSTGGTDYTKKKTALERFQYYRKQASNIPGVKRWATVDELFEGLANGRKQKLNFSLPKNPKTGKKFTMAEWMADENAEMRLSSPTWLTVRASEIGSLKDAIQRGLDTGNWNDAYFLMLNMKGRFPQDLNSLAKFRTMLYAHIAEALPNANGQKISGVVSTLSNIVRSGLKSPSKLETPYIGADGHTEIVPGMWVKYKNNMGRWSVGKVVRRRPSDDMARPTQAPDGASFQHHDQVVVEFANGQVVDQITAEHLTPLKKGDEGYEKPTKYEGRPVKSARQKEREALTGLAAAFKSLQPEGEDDAEPETPGAPEAPSAPSGPSKVDDLVPGGMFFSKSGEPLGKVVEIVPITGKGGKRGFSIAYETPSGETKVVNVAAGELRGPKA